MSWVIRLFKSYRQGFKDGFEQGMGVGIKSARKLPENYLVMSKALLEDYKERARAEERALWIGRVSRSK